MKLTITNFYCCFLLLFFSFIFQIVHAQTTIVSYGSNWKYLDNNTRPGNWETVGFNDASWASGSSELGYGDGDENTTVSYGSDANNKYITTYFRKSIAVTGLTNYNSFQLNVIRDDGIVIYINGVLVASNNMPGGTPGHGTLASSSTSGSEETTPVNFNLSPCAFVEGTNIIAVEIHQRTVTSSDISFNLELIGTTGGGTPSLTRGPYLQVASETGLTFRWRTNNACFGRVSVGSSNGDYTTATADETCPTTEHIVRVTGLTTDTKYFYQIAATDGTIFQGGANNFFTTNPPANTTRKIRIVAFGDCGRANSAYQDDNLANYLNYLSTNGIEAPDAWILMGDNAYFSGTDAEYTSKFFNTYGGLLKNHKLFPSPGNHDYGNSSSNKSSRSMPYHQIFSVPQNGESGGVASNKQNYYSYNLGNIHFLSLDSYGVESDGTSMQTSGASQLKTWLDADLAANTSKWVIAYWHHPPYTHSSHNSDNEGDLINIRQNFIGFLEGRGVDLIICGHSHAYERGYLINNYTGSWNSFNAATHAVSTSSATYTSSSTCPYVYNSSPSEHGTVYVVAGSAGASGGTDGGFSSGPMPFAVNDAGIFYFEVEDNRLDAKMLRRNGTIFDRFTIMKDVNQTTNYNIPNGGSQNLTASWPQSSGNYTWTTGVGTSRTINVSPPDNTTTNYTVTDAFGCVSDQFNVTTFAIVPVNIIKYSVRLVNGKVNVTWTTASENNTDYFTVERTVNSIDFNPIGTVDAAGSSATERSYFFTDDKPMKGTSFYKLSQTDADGRKQYLGIRRIVNNHVMSFDVKSLSGNPGTLVLQINTSRQGKFNIKVYDVNGRKFTDKSFNLSSGLTNKEVVLKTGTYIWVVRNEKGETIKHKTIIR